MYANGTGRTPAGAGAGEGTASSYAVPYVGFNAKRNSEAVISVVLTDDSQGQEHKSRRSKILSNRLLSFLFHY